MFAILAIRASPETNFAPRVPGMPVFLVVLVVLVLLGPCANKISDLGLCNQGPAYGLKPSITAAVSARTQFALSFSVLSGFFGAATPARG